MTSGFDLQFDEDGIWVTKDICDGTLEYRKIIEAATAPIISRVRWTGKIDTIVAWDWMSAICLVGANFEHEIKQIRRPASARTDNR
jgi:hypothetical protein